MGRVKSKPTKAKAKAKAKVKPKREIKNDKAQKILGIRTRNKFKDICDKYHIEQKTINNQPVGFLRTEIETSKFSWSWKRKRRMFSPPFFTHRDLLAANNILRKGISELESMCKTSSEASYACIQESHSL